MLEQPWVPMAIMGGMVVTTLITMTYATYRVTRERSRRKALEGEHTRLLERYEQLRVNFEQQVNFSQRLITSCTNMSPKVETPTAADQQK